MEIDVTERTLPNFQVLSKENQKTLKISNIFIIPKK